ncbi:hypothetical protein V8G54_000136 (mitochondrion) [Vigna mungo]|uniref:Retrotransposon gag domain-containing protein n=1 Tax=Vigna mungo TaxID=3915 RepID=A0AAQ3PFV5_VIGMU
MASSKVTGPRPSDDQPKKEVQVSGNWRQANIFRSLNPTKKDLRVPSTIALEEVKAGMARVETSLKEEVEGLKATKEKLRIKVSILALRGQWPTECHALSQLQEDAKALENFLWRMEPDFKASKMEDEEEKVKTAISYLIDDATLWWRWRYADLEKGLCRIKTWEELKIGQGRNLPLTEHLPFHFKTFYIQSAFEEGPYTREEILAIGTTSRQKKDAIRPQPKKRVIRKTSMDFGTWPGSLSIIATLLLSSIRLLPRPPSSSGQKTSSPATNPFPDRQTTHIHDEHFPEMEMKASKI